MNNKRRVKRKEAVHMPENLEGSERYEKMETAVDLLEEASSFVDEAREKLDEASE